MENLSWDEVRERMEARTVLAAKAIGILGAGVGLVLLRRPVPRWVSLGTLADGALIATTGQGVLVRVWNAVTKVVREDVTTGQ